MRPMACRAAVLHGPKQPFKLEEVELADLPEHCVLIRTMASGICGGDVHRFQGTSEHEFPIILGHEATGVVEGMGSSVREFREGDHVVVSDARPCLACKSCLRDPPNPCERANEIFLTHPAKRIGGQPVRAFHCIGSLSEYVIAAATSTLKLPPQVPWAIGALIACGGQTGLGSVFNIAKPNEGSSVAVFGCGAVGLSVVMAAKLFGASPIVACDIIPRRLELAKLLGADNIINSLQVDPAKQILQIAGKGCD